MYADPALLHGLTKYAVGGGGGDSQSVFYRNNFPSFSGHSVELLHSGKTSVLT